MKGHRKPTDKEKKLLVSYKKYKTIEEIPEFVSHETLNKMHVINRLKNISYLTFGIFVGALVYGKTAGYILREREGVPKVSNR